MIFRQGWMESIGGETCSRLKQKYESCFYNWYTEKFLKGNIQEECQDLFDEYRLCLKAVLKEKKLDILLEESH